MNAMFALVRSLPKRVAVLAIQFYRAAISPIFGPCCRYVPTCSEYGLEACHPFHEGGYDPVPDKL